MRTRAVAALLAVFHGAAAILLQRRSATLAATEVRPESVVVLLAGAADAPRRLAALRALCTDVDHAGSPRTWTVLVGDDDELDDDSGSAWGPVLVDRVRAANVACLAPRLVPGRVRTTGEELDALARFLEASTDLTGRPLLFVTSPYHRARVEAGARARPSLAHRDRHFLAAPLSFDDVAPHTVFFETARLARDSLGLADALGRRTLDAIRERTPWARPRGRR